MYCYDVYKAFLRSYFGFDVLCGNMIFGIWIQNVKLVYFPVYWAAYLTLLFIRLNDLITFGLWMLALWGWHSIEQAMNLTYDIRYLGLDYVWDYGILSIVWLELAWYWLIYIALGWAIEAYWWIELAIWTLFWLVYDTIMAALWPAIEFIWWLITYIPNLTGNWGTTFILRALELI